MSNKGWPSSQKTTNQIYQTIQPLGAGKHGADVLPKAMSALSLIDLVPEATSGLDYIDLAGHSIKAGDMIRFTAGDLDRDEVAVSRVEPNRIYLSHKFETEILPADTFIPLRAVTLTIDKGGNLATSSGPIQFIKDGAAQQVLEDTITPANNAPLPVKLTGATGDINITAGDLNVQTSHVGANYDSQRIGDGTTELEIIPVTREAKVSDANAKSVLDALLVELALKADLTETQPVSLASSPLPTGAATETTLAAVLAKIIAAPATEAKQDSSITELQSILAKIIVAPATEAKQDTSITALGDILAKIIVAPATEAKQDTNITALGDILAKIIAAPATEAKQDAIIAALGSSDITVLDSSFTASPTVPTATRLATGVTVPALKKGTELEILTKAGDNFTAYDAVTGGNVIGRFTQAGGRLPVALTAATAIFLQSDTGADFTANDLTINLIGVDA